jgi:hypothetical protein
MSRTLPRRATAVNSGAESAVLRTLAMEGVGLALWDRRPPGDFQAWLDALPDARLPSLRATAPATRVGPAVAGACAAAGLPEGPHRDRLVGDIAEMAHVVSEVLAAPVLDIRLDVTTGQACPKWHVDTVRARLLCTLRGPGTEFGPATPDGTPARIHRVPTGWAGLFRGFLWPGREVMGLVHRSPPARGSAAARLLLVLDPAEDAGTC